ncbi:DUF1214 domain-containing protein [Uliginosibacterium aquaticum]|uniref:DUF1214 domain-containing protein n=1 Tax=Uliginosibacterium aquaticum TaxID=2731212 RepID=A0ABX2IKS2_9RHOO|nr:DUF1214 domain-containing protein [Uliginosibacterium aquaticum]NSL54923.1 DUF1214 domain-containing protein [Uliginosibacterium aquaticum]
MSKNIFVGCAMMVLGTFLHVPIAQAAPVEVKPIPVTVDTFVRAETDRYFKQRYEQGAFGKFHHERGPVDVDKQLVIRMNRDTPYSTGVFDLTQPLTIVKPDTHGRFQSILVFNQDHYIQRVIYEPGTYTFTQEEMGTRYIQVTVRTLVNPNDPADIEEMRKAQDAVQAIQSDPGSFEVPNWDQKSLSALRKAILTMTPWVPDSRRMFGTKAEVGELRHFIGTAGGIFGNAEKDAIYMVEVPKKNDGKTPFKLTVKDVPVDAFWSITVYNKNGFYEPPTNAISLNSYTAKPNADGSITVNFGGDPKAGNYLRIMPGWNYLVRLYRPRAEVLDGSWTFPKAMPIK